jgi:hypothetical protein
MLVGYHKPAVLVIDAAPDEAHGTIVTADGVSLNAAFVVAVLRAYAVGTVYLHRCGTPALVERLRACGVSVGHSAADADDASALRTAVAFVASCATPRVIISPTSPPCVGVAATQAGLGGSKGAGPLQAWEGPAGARGVHR